MKQPAEIVKDFFSRCKQEHSNIQPKIEVSIDNIKINGYVDFCHSTINLELDERATKEIGQLFLDGQKKYYIWHWNNYKYKFDNWLQIFKFPKKHKDKINKILK